MTRIIEILSPVQVLEVTFILLFSISCSGCSVNYTYRDINKSDHILAFGLVDIQKAPHQNWEIGGEGISIVSFGIGLLDTESGKSISLGYNKQTDFILHDNALILQKP